MEPDILRHEERYGHYLQEVESLAADDPPAASTEGARLEQLATLLEQYERARFEFARPDLAEAILFRVEQEGLR